MKSEGRPLPRATPELAQRVWARQQRPSVRRVAQALRQAGYPVHFVTVARWHARNWKAEESEHPLEIARGRLEAVATMVTGNPEPSLADLIHDPARGRDFAGLTDAEVLRRAAREAAIATALIWKAIKDRISKPDFDILELTPALSALGHSMHALPAAFEQVIDLNEAEQRKKGMRT
jgi:hypothetical protein